jgi:hypothetical protein
MATWEDVRRIAAELPEADESTVYRKAALKVRGKSFAWMSPHEKEALVTRIDPDELPFLLAAKPELYFMTPHYEGHAMVLIRLEAAGDDELRERLTDSWELASG